MEDQGRALHSNIAKGVRMLGDRTLLTQMFANLIENAYVTHRQGHRSSLGWSGIGLVVASPLMTPVPAFRRRREVAFSVDLFGSTPRAAHPGTAWGWR